MSVDTLFARAGLERARIETLVDRALHRADDGELFVETGQSEAFVFDDGRLRSANYDTTQGFGLRSVCGEATGFAYATEISEAAIARAADAVRAAAAGHDGTVDIAPPRANGALYGADNPLGSADFATKAALVQEIDAYARGKDARVRQVSCSLSGSWRQIAILRAGGETYADIRPLVQLSVSVVVEDGGRQESGSFGGGGRFGYESVIAPDYWRAAVDEALRQALVNLQSVPAPAGEMSVVLGAGWPGILLHEAVGHGLEGDFNRKMTSAFSGLIGQRVAAPGVTVIDDGTMAQRRGSLTIDDEGTPTSRTVLIEDGILRGYMQDRQNARLMGVKPTGNGRRESFAAPVMPRMTNTYMLGGNATSEEVISSVKSGIYAVQFGGGQVDITSGKFVFSCTEAYKIEDGRITAPLKGATLIGNGPDALTKVVMIGNDMKLDTGIGTCGKNGQSVPVGVGQPTLRIDGLTVGGTEA